MDEFSCHQKNLDSAFWWVEFAYRQGNALLEATRGRLAEHGFPKPLSGVCYNLGKSSAYKYVWMDCSWYLPEESEHSKMVPFVALSYTSGMRVGTHLLVGTAELVGKSAGLLAKPPKSEDRHWLLDEALNWDDYPKIFDVSLQSDGTMQHSLLKATEAYHDGLKTIISASFPVAWIDAENRIEKIAAGLFALRETGDSSPLGALSQEAVAAANPKRSTG